MGNKSKSPYIYTKDSLSLNASSSSSSNKSSSSRIKVTLFYSPVAIVLRLQVFLTLVAFEKKRESGFCFCRGYTPINTYIHRYIDTYIYTYIHTYIRTGGETGMIRRWLFNPMGGEFSPVFLMEGHVR
jgi:hypothetical protein